MDAAFEASLVVTEACDEAVLQVDVAGLQQFASALLGFNADSSTARVDLALARVDQSQWSSETTTTYSEKLSAFETAVNDLLG